MKKQVVGEDIEIAFVADKAAIDAAVIRVSDPIKLRWIAHRQSAQQNTLHQREDRGVGSNAESKRNHCRQRKAGRLPQLAKCIADILHRILEEMIHCDSAPMGVGW